MIGIIVLFIAPVIVSRRCPNPRLPLASHFTPHYDEDMAMVSGQLSCQSGFIGVGISKLKCNEESGEWQETDFLCSTNVALHKPTFYNSNSSQAGSQAAVDGDIEPGGSVYKCDQLNKENKIFSVDLQEPVKVFGVKISSHNSGETVKNIEVNIYVCQNLQAHDFVITKIRVGDSEDHSENSICWFIPQLKQEEQRIYRCPDSLLGR